MIKQTIYTGITRLVMRELQVFIYALLLLIGGYLVGATDCKADVTNGPFAYSANVWTGTNTYNKVVQYGTGQGPILLSTVTGQLIFSDLTGGDTVRSIVNLSTVKSDVTNSAFYTDVGIITDNATFTVGTVGGYRARVSSIGAASTVTSLTGFYSDSTLAGATNTYGFRGDVTSGTNKYNLYMGGTAQNYLAGDLKLGKTITAAGTTGAQTINKTALTVNLAAAASSLVVSNTLVNTSSIITCTVASNDATAKSVSAVAAAGSFTIRPNLAPTAETRVNCLVIN